MSETHIITHSGTRYILADMTVTRYGRTAVVDRYGNPVAGEQAELDRADLLDCSTPTVGLSWHFRTPAGLFDTTRVAQILVAS